MPALAVLALVCTPLVGDPEPVDLSMVTRIRAEGLERSRVMETFWYLTDLYGPRLTSSPQERRASEWARERLTEFGLSGARLEAWFRPNG